MVHHPTQYRGDDTLQITSLWYVWRLAGVHVFRALRPEKPPFLGLIFRTDSAVQ